MFTQVTTFLKKLDWVLLFLPLLLVTIGLVTQYSLIINSENPDFSPFYKQVFAFVISIFIFIALSYFDFRWFNNYGSFLYIFSFLALLGLLFFGQSLRGTRGWYIIGPISFQPIEIVKILTVIFLAKFFSNRLKKNNYLSFTHLVFSGLFILALFILVILQPDLGSALLLFGIWFLIFLLVSKKRLQVLAVTLLIIAVAISAWFFLLKDYQKERVLTFLDPNRDPLGIGYQVNQSIIAVGSGKFFGRGLGLGPQSQLRFLPDSSTDFIFSVIAEEFGFLGVIIVIGLFALLLGRIMSYTKIASSDFSLILIIGFLNLFFLQIFINISMNIGLLPVTGIPLPFISYGSSSLIAFFVALGLLESIRVHRVKSSPPLDYLSNR